LPPAAAIANFAKGLLARLQCNGRLGMAHSHVQAHRLRDQQWPTQWLRLPALRHDNVG